MPIFPWIPIPPEVVMIVVIIVTIVIVVIIVLLYALGKGIEKALDYRTGRMIFGTIILLLSPFVNVINFIIPWLGILIIALGAICIIEGIHWASPLYAGILWMISVGVFAEIMTSLFGIVDHNIFLPITFIFPILGLIHILVGLPLCIGMGAYTLYKRSRQDATAPTPSIPPKQKSEPKAQQGSCPNCSKAVKPGWEHCPECGTHLD